jgi:hypothetical protein
MDKSMMVLNSLLIHINNKIKLRLVILVVNTIFSKNNCNWIKYNKKQKMKLEFREKEKLYRQRLIRLRKPSILILQWTTNQMEDRGTTRQTVKNYWILLELCQKVC